MKWYIIDKNYVEYLRIHDNNVQNIVYEDKVKPYIGIILNINDFNYYVPVSSVKPRHQNMKNSIDFFKIEDEKRLFGVLNINNMIPVYEEYITNLNYREIDKYRSFQSETEKTNYISLLTKELSIINMNEDLILKSASRLYEIKNDHPDSKLSMRCCNFKLLEEKAKEYKK